VRSEDEAPAAAAAADLAPPSRPLVACLCAAWCGTCRDYRATFDAVAAATPDHDFEWIDIEDESALFDHIELDLDIETFPTIAIVHRGEMRFFGPLLPQAGALARLVEASRQERQAVGVDAREAGVLAQRLGGRGRTTQSRSGRQPST